MSQTPAPFDYQHSLDQADPDLWKMMEDEVVRQQDHIELIASENYTSTAVMQAQGSQLTNKYAEGYPGKRFYGGCEFVDKVLSMPMCSHIRARKPIKPFTFRF